MDPLDNVVRTSVGPRDQDRLARHGEASLVVLDLKVVFRVSMIFSVFLVLTVSFLSFEPEWG